MDANQRECLDEHLICVYLCPFAVENSTSRFVFFNKDFVRISVLSKVGFQLPTKFHEEPCWLTKYYFVPPLFCHANFQGSER